MFLAFIFWMYLDANATIALRQILLLCSLDGKIPFNKSNLRPLVRDSTSGIETLKLYVGQVQQNIFITYLEKKNRKHIKSSSPNIFILYRSNFSFPGREATGILPF